MGTQQSAVSAEGSQINQNSRYVMKKNNFNSSFARIQ